MHPGKFYALPQAPQQFKQLLMISGFDRYFQIAPCFRDEEPARRPLAWEFYQLDVEMSFVTQEDVFAAIEPVMHGALRGVRRRQAGDALTVPAHPLRRGMAKYGTDKPDLRNPIVMQDVSEHFRGGGFGVRRHPGEGPEGAVWAIPAPSGGSRAFCDRMNSWAQGEGQPGLGYIFWREDQGGWGGPIAKNLRPRADRARSWAQLGLGQRRRGLLRGRRSGEIRQVRGRGAHQGRPRAEARRPRTASSSAGSSTSRCTNGTRTRRRSTSRTTRSRCRRAGWRR